MYTYTPYTAILISVILKRQAWKLLRGRVLLRTHPGLSLFPLHLLPLDALDLDVPLFRNETCVCSLQTVQLEVLGGRSTRQTKTATGVHMESKLALGRAGFRSGAPVL